MQRAMLAALISVIAIATVDARSTPPPAGFKPQVSWTLPGKKLVFAVIGDWGHVGGDFSDGTLANCLAQNKAFLNGSGPLPVNPGPATGNDPMGNACGGLQQLATAKLMDAVCADKMCQFVVNTGDNFYTEGCYAAGRNVSESLKCSKRFMNDWENVYNTADHPALMNLPWLNSLGNHDVLGYKDGVDEQIAYHSMNKKWVLPARYYSADVKAGRGPSVRFHVAHTSCFVSKYRKNTSPYYNDEIIACSNATAVAAQLAFLGQSMDTSMADYNIVIGHHPFVSTCGPSYSQASQATDGWTGLSNLVSQHGPAAYMNGHDHAMSFQYLDMPAVEQGANLSTGFPATGFYTSGAGGYTQGGDGGYGLPSQFSWSKYTNVDLTAGISRGGFAIVTVTKTSMTVEYYSQEQGKNVPFTVVTPNMGVPSWTASPFAVSQEINMGSDGAIQFRKLMEEKNLL